MHIELLDRMEQHVLDFWKNTQDEEIKKMFPFSTSTLEDALDLFRASLEPDATSYGKVIYVDGIYVGDVWLYNIDENDEKMGMISIVIFRKESWGQGIGTRVIKMFCDACLEKFEIEKVGAFTYVTNISSIRALKKCGFDHVETFVENDVESMYLEYKG